jgi:hypothetical protein
MLPVLPHLLFMLSASLQHSVCMCLCACRGPAYPVYPRVSALPAGGFLSFLGLGPKPPTGSGSTKAPHNMPPPVSFPGRGLGRFRAAHLALTVLRVPFLTMPGCLAYPLCHQVEEHVHV